MSCTALHWARKCTSKTTFNGRLQSPVLVQRLIHCALFTSISDDMHEEKFLNRNRYRNMRYSWDRTAKRCVASSSCKSLLPAQYTEYDMFDAKKANQTAD